MPEGAAAGPDTVPADTTQPAEGIHVEVDHTAEDWMALLHNHRAHEGRTRFRLIYGYAALPVILYAIRYWMRGRAFGFLDFLRADVVVALVFAAIAVGWLVFLGSATRRSAARLASAEGPVRFTFNETGWARRTDVRESTTDWSGVRRIDETEDHFFVILDTTAPAAVIAEIIPKRALDAADHGPLRRLFTAAVPHPEAA